MCGCIRSRGNSFVSIRRVAVDLPLTVTSGLCSAQLSGDGFWETSLLLLLLLLSSDASLCFSREASKIHVVPVSLDLWMSFSGLKPCCHTAAVALWDRDILSLSFSLVFSVSLWAHVLDGEM